MGWTARSKQFATSKDPGGLWQHARSAWSQVRRAFLAQ